MQCVEHWISQNRSATMWSSDNNDWKAIDWAWEGMAKDYADKAALLSVIECLEPISS